MKMDQYYLNGQILPAAEARLHVSDLGLLRAYGIFDYFRAIERQPIFLEDHLDRFERSAALLGLVIPATRDELRNLVYELSRRNPHALLGFKFVLTGGYSTDGFGPAAEPNFIIMPKPFRFLDAPAGLHFMTVGHQRQLFEVKSLDYLMPIYTLRRQREIGADDVLYHHNGLITESSRSNVFIVKDGIVVTPSAGMLLGITRKHVMKIADDRFTVEEREVTLAETCAADEVFTTGSTKRVLPVTRIDGRPVGSGRPGPVTQQLTQMFLEYERELLTNVPARS
ncbi:MAG: aminotransferase class IV [Cytophagaceae bacterium]|nr:aminotransferase class IV [Cytophagaceae bacterium]